MTNRTMIENTLAQANEALGSFEAAARCPRPTSSGRYFAGVDLGTACVVLAVVDAQGRPVAGGWRWADVVRDGMVVDYLQAVDIVSELKAQAEADLGAELEYAAAAIPPGTDALDGGAVRHVVESAGFTLTDLCDESTAANEVLKIDNGAVVDVGGGTTGISIFRDGKVIATADEPTGGTHFSLVLAGAWHQTFEAADLYKRDPAHHAEILPVLKPSVEKVASIIRQHIAGSEVDCIYLVGGTSCLSGMEDIIAAELDILTVKPANPLFVTPLGIALACSKANPEEAVCS